MRRPIIVDVAPRDGFQAVAPFIPTTVKVELCRKLIAAGLNRIEIGSFVNPCALPQMSDIREVLAAIRSGPHPELSVLVPNRRGAEAALEAGIDALVYVVSASESHNQNNVRRTVGESMDELVATLRDLRPAGRFRFNLATTFHCPFEGATPPEVALNLIERVIAIRPDAEIGLCDTTGYAMPHEVAELVRQCLDRFGEGIRLAYHAHDTYGFGVATTMAAFEAGVDVIDAAVAGLGGCPFAPGATGNVATEDVVFAFERLGLRTGIGMAALLDAADLAIGIEGGKTGGHVGAVVRGRRQADSGRGLWRDAVLGV